MIYIPNFLSTKVYIKHVLTTQLSLTQSRVRKAVGEEAHKASFDR